MGRRKSSRRSQVKKIGKPKLETSFSCPYCNEESSVECKLDRTKQTGTATCRACQAGYQTIINCIGTKKGSLNFLDLTDPVDIFGEWIDAIDAQNKQKEARRQRLTRAQVENSFTKSTREDSTTTTAINNDGQEEI